MAIVGAGGSAADDALPLAKRGIAFGYTRGSRQIKAEASDQNTPHEAHNLFDESHSQLETANASNSRSFFGRAHPQPSRELFIRLPARTPFAPRGFVWSATGLNR